MKNRLKAPRLAEVKIADDFWSPYISRVRDIMIPYQWKILNDQVEHAAPSHCIENFRIAAGESKGEYYGAVFQDTDLAFFLDDVGLVYLHWFMEFILVIFLFLSLVI